jgi:hypothetical protein
MGVFGFGKRPVNKTFGYSPQFYDPVKEKLNMRLGKVDPNLSEEEQRSERIKYNLRQRAGYSTNQKMAAKLRSQSNIRLLLIIGVLTLVTITILQSDSILNFVESISK